MQILRVIDKGDGISLEASFKKGQPVSTFVFDLDDRKRWGQMRAESRYGGFCKTIEPRTIQQMRSFLLPWATGPAVLIVERKGRISVEAREPRKATKKYRVEAYSHATAQVADRVNYCNTKYIAEALQEQLGQLDYIEKVTITETVGGAQTVKYFDRFCAGRV